MKKQKDKISLRSWVKVLGVAGLFGTFLTLVLTFIGAYSNSSKTILININSIGEAKFEMFIFIPLVFIFGIIALYLVAKDEANK